jgi:hypothetical protein
VTTKASRSHPRPLLHRWIRRSFCVAALAIGLVTAGCDDAHDGPAMVEKAAATGQTGTARVLSGRDTNNRRDARKFFAFRLDVTPDDGTPPFTEEMQTLMDPLAASQVRPGSSAKIKYLRGDVAYFVFR